MTNKKLNIIGNHSSMSGFLEAQGKSFPPNITWQEAFVRLLTLGERFSRHAIAAHMEEIMATYPEIQCITVRPKHFEIKDSRHDLVVNSASESKTPRSLYFPKEMKKGELLVDEGEALFRNMEEATKYIRIAQQDVSSQLFYAIKISRSFTRLKEGDYWRNDARWETIGKTRLGAVFPNIAEPPEVMAQTFLSPSVIGTEQKSMSPSDIFSNLRKAASICLLMEMEKEVSYLKEDQGCGVGGVEVAASFARQVSVSQARRIGNTSSLKFVIRGKNSAAKFEPSDLETASGRERVGRFMQMTKNWQNILRSLGDEGVIVVRAIGNQNRNLQGSCLESYIAYTYDPAFARQVVSSIEARRLRRVAMFNTPKLGVEENGAGAESETPSVKSPGKGRVF